ncbi:MAG: hypothetical protein HDR21_10600 [Lachnospiraceae bacterium]|nr:hypothetical protein [Lachnospiraceae bacterium]
MKKQDNGDEKSAEIQKKGNDVGVTNNNWKMVTILLACALAISVGLHIWGLVRYSKVQNMQTARDGAVVQGEQAAQEEALLIESIYLENGDNVHELPVINADGVNLSGLTVEKDMNLVVYLSDSCAGCINSMGTLRDIMGVFGEDEMGYAYIYSNSVPRNLEEKYGISREFCYCLGENLMLATSLPTFYLVDGDGIVVFSTDKLELITQKLLAMEILPQETLIKQADAYLTARYFSGESDRYKMIYFAMKGCGDCEAADELVNAEAIRERYEIVRIYRDKSEVDGEIDDENGLFRQVYGIVWYPSFEILRGTEREFVGEVSLEELERILLK